MKNSLDKTFNISLHLCECYPTIHLHEGNWSFALHDPTCYSLLIGQLALCEVFFTIKITNHLKIHKTQLALGLGPHRSRWTQHTSHESRLVELCSGGQKTFFCRWKFRLKFLFFFCSETWTTQSQIALQWRKFNRAHFPVLGCFILSFYVREGI